MILTMRALTGYSFVSRGIAWRSGGWSHIDFASPGGTGWWSAYENEVDGIPSGCRWRPKNYYGRIRAVTTVEIELDYVEWLLFWSAVKRTDGRPYDKTGLIENFIFAKTRDWRDTSSFWCSEWFIWLLEQSRRIAPIDRLIKRVDPGMALGIASSHGVNLGKEQTGEVLWQGQIQAA